jgi:hypothetical protein
MTFDQWQTLVGAEAHSLVGDPQFVAPLGHSLRPGLDSAAAELVPLSVLPPDALRDFFGIARDSGARADAGAIEIPLISADFNRDGAVDGSDFLSWQAGLGVDQNARPADGNADADHDVDAEDLAVWAAQFGASSPAAALPEPASFTLVALAGTDALGRRRRRLAAAAGSPRSSSLSA